MLSAPGTIPEEAIVMLFDPSSVIVTFAPETSFNVSTLASEPVNVRSTSAPLWEEARSYVVLMSV